jgi:hypothetical protein
MPIAVAVGTSCPAVRFKRFTMSIESAMLRKMA